MATIKSYTDLEQSKKLAEILPIESADMYYSKHPSENYYSPIPLIGVYSKIHDQIPCWSLAALYNILPNNEDISTTLYHDYKDGLDKWFCEHDSLYTEVFGVQADNPIDACYEMILKERDLI